MEPYGHEPKQVQGGKPPGAEGGSEQRVRILGFVAHEFLKLHVCPEIHKVEPEGTEDDNSEHEHVAGAPAVGGSLAGNLIALDSSAGGEVLEREPAAVSDMHHESQCEHRHHDGDDGEGHEVATELEEPGCAELAGEGIDHREEVDGAVQKQEQDEESAADGLYEFLSDG